MAWYIFFIRPAFVAVAVISQGTEHHWFDSDAMEDQIGSMVENAVSDDSMRDFQLNTTGCLIIYAQL